MSVKKVAPITVETAAGEKIFCDKGGQVKLNTGQGTVEVFAYFVPDFAISLISIASLHQQLGFKSVFNGLFYEAIMGMCV